MERSLEPELLDKCIFPDSVTNRIYRELAWTNTVLGNAGAIVARIRQHSRPVRRVLDIGCGHGGLLLCLRRRLRVDVVGVDLRPPRRANLPFPILQRDAARDRLPQADVAVCVFVAHHLSEQEVAALIQNAGRSCGRLILLDLVRSRLPLALFRAFVAPFLGHVNAVDGVRSICRAYTAAEMGAIVQTALAGTTAAFTHTVAPMRIRQIVDVTY